MKSFLCQFRIGILSIVIFSGTLGVLMAIDYQDLADTPPASVPFHAFGSMYAMAKTDNQLVSAPLNLAVVKATVIAAIDADQNSNTGCWYARVNLTTPIVFQFTSQIVIPLPGTVCTTPHAGAVISQTFYNDLRLHESWHRWIYQALIYSVWVPLEQWLEAYKSYSPEGFQTKQQAIAAATKDINRAFSDVANIQAKFLKDKSIGHPGSPGQPAPYSVQSGNTLVSNNPNWGMAAFNIVSAYSPSFYFSPGNCPHGGP